MDSPGQPDGPHHDGPAPSATVLRAGTTRTGAGSSPTQPGPGLTVTAPRASAARGKAGVCARPGCGEPVTGRQRYCSARCRKSEENRRRAERSGREETEEGQARIARPWPPGRPPDRRPGRPVTPARRWTRDGWARRSGLPHNRTPGRAGGPGWCVATREGPNPMGGARPSLPHGWHPVAGLRVHDVSQVSHRMRRARSSGLLRPVPPGTLSRRRAGARTPARRDRQGDGTSGITPGGMAAIDAAIWSRSSAWPPCRGRRGGQPRAGSRRARPQSPRRIRARTGHSANVAMASSRAARRSPALAGRSRSRTPGPAQSSHRTRRRTPRRGRSGPGWRGRWWPWSGFPSVGGPALGTAVRGPSDSPRSADVPRTRPGR